MEPKVVTPIASGPAPSAGLSNAEHQAIRAIADTTPYIPEKHPTQRWFSPDDWGSLGMPVDGGTRIVLYRSAGAERAELAMRGELFNVWALLTPHQLRSLAGMCLAASRDIEANQVAAAAANVEASAPPAPSQATRPEWDRVPRLAQFAGAPTATAANSSSPWPPYVLAALEDLDDWAAEYGEAAPEYRKKTQQVARWLATPVLRKLLRAAVGQMSEPSPSARSAP